MDSELITLISRSDRKCKLYHDPSRPLRLQYLRYWTPDEGAVVNDVIPLDKMNLLRKKSKSIDERYAISLLFKMNNMFL